MKKIAFVILMAGLVAPLTAGEPKECSGECATACCTKETALKASALTKVQFKVSNISCETSCGELSKTIAALEGVKTQAVCGESHVATIEIEPSKTNPKTLYTALVKAGYEIEGQQLSVKVKGMTCGGCSAGLSKTLTSTKGVVQNEVCHESGTAKVLFDPTKIDSQQIAAVITKEGYSVE